MTAPVVADEMTKRNDVSVKMDADVVNDARLAATFKGLSLAEYLSDVVRPVAARDIDEGYAKRKRSEKGETHKGGDGHKKKEHK